MFDVDRLARELTQPAPGPAHFAWLRRRLLASIARSQRIVDERDQVAHRDRRR